MLVNTIVPVSLLLLMVTAPVPVIAPEIVAVPFVLKSGSPLTVIALLIEMPSLKFSDDRLFMTTVFVPRALLAPTITALPAVRVVPPL